MSDRLRTALGAWFPAFVIAAAFAWAVVSIFVLRRKEETSHARVTLRIAHWQLEAGVREAVDRMAEEYGRIHPDVKIIQEAVPEKTYAQWITTQLMGGSPPDIVELGKVPYPILIGYLARYFVPMTPYVDAPNPYNAGTEMDGMPLRKTIRDGMRSTYYEELQEYMGVPLSSFGLRIYYNRTLLRELTGMEMPPSTYREFVETCSTIASKRNADGAPYIPIAAASIHFSFWESMLFDPITFPATRVADLNRDGLVGGDEVYVAMKAGLIDFHFPAYEARFRMIGRVTPMFQPGYTGLTRDEAVLVFAQQRAVFITTGSWDVYSLQEQAGGSFEVGIMDFPMPSKDDPELGRWIEGPRYENVAGGFTFGVTRACPDTDAAVDFLRFLSSRTRNEAMNRTIGWIPIVKGAPMSPLLRAFEPHLEGVNGAFRVTMGGETVIRWQQLYTEFQIGSRTYDELVRDYEPFFLNEGGPKDYAELLRNTRRRVGRDELFMAGVRSRARMTQAGVRRDSLWIKYRQVVDGRIIWRSIVTAHMARLADGTAIGEVRAPYRYRPEVLARHPGIAKALEGNP